MNKRLDIRSNTMSAMLEKNPADFTRADICEFVEVHGIKMVNFMYPAADGRLKTLNFVLHTEGYLEGILSFGERVDGSSLFPLYIEAGSSDMYVVPRLRTAFIDRCRPSVSSARSLIKRVSNWRLHHNIFCIRRHKNLPSKQV